MDQIENFLAPCAETAAPELHVSDEPGTKGNIYRGATLVSSTFKNPEQIQITGSEDFDRIIMERSKDSTNFHFTICYEGALVKLCYDDKGELQFSNNSKVNCRGSFWGNKEETFFKVFNENGGDKFIAGIEQSKTPNVSHHFMLMTRNLVVTSRIDLRDNETIVVYLGSVDINGNIINPSSYSREVYHYHNIVDRNVLPTREELFGRILIPSRIDFQTAKHIIYNGYDPHTYPEQVITKDITHGECVIARYNDQKIIKFLPSCYEHRDYIAGNTPNVKNRFFRLMDVSRSPEYTEKIACQIVLTDEQIGYIYQEPKTNATRNIVYFAEKNGFKEPESVPDKMRAILTFCLLCCPLAKVNQFIDAWRDYTSCKESVVKFLKKNNSKISSGNFDEALNERHSNALGRLKDMAKVSKSYASETKNQYSYHSKLEYSIRGLVSKEFGPSLYRIEKAMKTLTL